MKDKLLKLYTQLAAVPSTSGNEGLVRGIILEILTSLHIANRVDEYGNVIATLQGSGNPVLLNAHMDRVKPGLGFTPVIKGDLIYSDGKTNSGADDILGIISILTILEEIQKIPEHRTIHAVFTVEEEIGAIHGAKLVDIDSLGATDGIVIDNAFFDAGVLVHKGSNLVWAITTIKGKSGHSGKDLSQTVNALVPLLASDIQPGSYNNDETRLNIGSIQIQPGVGNAIPEGVTILTEFRSFLPEEALNKFIDEKFSQLNRKAGEIGAIVETQLDVHCKSYIIDMNEPLVKAYASVLEKQSRKLETQHTFVGSDANSFRARGLKTIVISTGARNEHTTSEYFDIQGITQLTQDIIALLQYKH